MRKKFESKITVSALWILFVASLVSLGCQLAYGSATLPIFKLLIGGVHFTFALRIDPLSCVMFSMVSLLSAVVGQYALRYLDGEESQGYFYKFFLITALCVDMLVLSSNLVMFFVAWLGMSLGLHQLLRLHQDRPAAVMAARKKFVVSRIGDIALLGAILLIYKIFGTFDFAEIFAQVEAGGGTTKIHETYFSAAAILLAAGAMTKSAQFPFHFWLPETMETPTPVSAMMHAGIINAGGFLVLRLTPLISHLTFASGLLALCGALTAVYGALVMSTQNNIKSKLAYSTISQMGMMMFACGIHAYSFALFHIVAHSFYKAHAFLSTASLVEERRQKHLVFADFGAGFVALAIPLLFGLVFYGSVWESGRYLPHLTYLAVIFMGLLQAGYRTGGSVSFYGLAFATLGVCAGVYTALEGALSSYISIEGTSDPNLMINLCALGVFAGGLVLSRLLLDSDRKTSQMLYMFFWNGGYFGSRTDRLFARIWPV